MLSSLIDWVVLWSENCGILLHSIQNLQKIDAESAPKISALISFKEFSFHLDKFLLHLIKATVTIVWNYHHLINHRCKNGVMLLWIHISCLNFHNKSQVFHGTFHVKNRDKVCVSLFSCFFPSSSTCFFFFPHSTFIFVCRPRTKAKAFMPKNEKKRKK